MAELEVLVIDPSDWRSPIESYIRNPTATSDSESAKLRVRASKYTLIDDILYKKSFTLPYLRYLGPDESAYALREIHEGICGHHLIGRGSPIKHLDRDIIGLL